METVGRYPTSAELASFRRSLAESPAEVDSLHPDWSTPTRERLGLVRDGAFAHELADGIGWLSSGVWRPLPVASRAFYANARREAAATRSRAYDDLLEAAADSLAWCDSESSYRDTLDSYGLDTFAPRRTTARLP